MPQIYEYNALGQSMWYDYLRRSIIKSGELKQLIDKGLGGVTANPSIFEKAIIGSNDYDDEIKRLVDKGRSIPEILETLMIDDVAMTADLFRPMYGRLDGKDGFVSIEVDSRLANDTEGMVREGRRYYSELGRPNVMIKIPATQAGMSAIRELTTEGINVNVTLIFSQRQYEQAADAYISGLEALDAKGKKKRQSHGFLPVSEFRLTLSPLLKD
jgi:transaldolase